MNKVKQIRENIGISQKAMAKHLDLSRAGYYKKEKGDTEFTVKEAIIISKLFNKKIEDIFC